MYNDLPYSEIVSDSLSGTRVYGRDKATVGFVRSVDGSGRNARICLVIGGILGFGGQEATLIADDLDFMCDDTGTIIGFTGRTKSELKAQLVQNASGRSFGFDYGQQYRQFV